MARLWDCDGLEVDALVSEYTAADDAELDNHLIEQDLITNVAHVRMLTAAGYLTKEDLNSILVELKQIREDWLRGEFVVTANDEDVHTLIESRVTARIGEAGKKIHTGRSRNDQVLTDLRLFLRLNLIQIACQTLDLAMAFDGYARRYLSLAMPGYTHMQRAMPSSIGLWAGAFAESLLDDARQIYLQYQALDTCPLGTGAGYGVSLKLKRDLSAELLGFSRLQYNSIYCQNSRGKHEGMALGTLSNLMMSLGRFASDVLLFTTSEYGFFSVEARLTTGSSIMPQKKNIDIMELLRARVRTVQAHEQVVKSIPVGLPSGYSRDLQETKKPIIEAFAQTRASLAITGVLLEGLTPDRVKLKSALSPELYATDEVFGLVDQGVPFRAAYQQVKARLSELNEGTRELKLDPGASLGTPENPGLERVLDLITGLKNELEPIREREEGLLARLLEI